MCECTVVAQSLSFLRLTAQVLSSSNSATEHPLLLFSFLWLPVISLLPIYSFRMPQILINLSSQLCPDYTLQVFEQTCTPLINDTTTHEQATALLTNLWTTSNTAEKLLWQAQVDVDELDTQAVCQLEEEVVLREAEALKEKEDLHREECKKNHSKFLPIPDHPVLQRAPVITAQSAT